MDTFKQLTKPIKPGVVVHPIGTSVKIVKDPHESGTLHTSQEGKIGLVIGYEFKPDIKYIHWYNYRLIIKFPGNGFIQSCRMFDHQVETVNDTD